MPLFGPWKFTVGDSPIDPKTGKPLCAEPDFDDSQWEMVDLTPKNGAIPNGGSSGYVPGWTARGHPGRYFGCFSRLRRDARTGGTVHRWTSRPGRFRPNCRRHDYFNDPCADLVPVFFVMMKEGALKRGTLLRKDEEPHTATTSLSA